MIYHITTPNLWKDWADADYYESPDLQEEGFIHCCKVAQLESVIQRYFKEVKDLIILHIDPDLLEVKLIYEPSTDNELFPHIYGKINKSAIKNIDFEYGKG
ncbi:MAG: hypothetical protein ACI8P3_000285 [Saprospiraceae bacterium]|jgi:uncharacterized protein (DUF952 family)